MDEYISRKAVMAAYEEEQRRPGPWRFETLINSVPAANVAPVVHGKWKYKEEWGKLLTNSCSVCGQILTTKRGEEMNYCPNCGAKMDQ